MILQFNNTTAEDIKLFDLGGISIPTGGYLELLYYYQITDITSSVSLRAYIESGDITITKNGNTLTIPEAIDYLDVATMYDVNAIKSLITQGSDILVTFGGDGDSDDDSFEVSSKHSKTIRRFYFAGTSSIGTPDCIKLIGSVDDEGDNLTFVLYDYLNNKTICSYTITSTNATINTVTSTSNWPTEESILEVRVNTQKSKQKGYINSLTIKF